MLLLRPYRDGDREACLGLFDSNVPKFFKPSERKDFVDFLDGERGSPELRYLIIEDDGAVVGCGGVGVRGRDARMIWGIVAHARQGEGLGRYLLLSRLRMGAREMGATTASLSTIPDTVGFFERVGFRVTASMDDHWGPGIHRRDLDVVLDEERVAALDDALASYVAGAEHGNRRAH